MKDVHVVGKKWPEMVIKWPFMSHNFFLTKLQKTGSKKKKGLCHSFDLIKIIGSLKASQNDCQILIFLKANLCSW